MYGVTTSSCDRVNSNDRPFACASSRRDDNNFSSLTATNRVTDCAPISFGGNISFVGNFLDVASVQATVTQTYAEVEERIAAYQRWINDKSDEFRAHYELNDVQKDTALFNKLDATIGRIKQGMKTLDQWHDRLRNVYTDILDNLAKYSNDHRTFQTLVAENTFYENENDNIKLAKQKSRKSKSISRLISRIMEDETRINTSLSIFNAELSAFNRNYIRVNKRRLNMLHLGEEIDALYASDSSLSIVQHNLADRINANDTRLTLRTNPNATIALTDFRLNNDAFPQNEATSVTTRQLLDRMQTLVSQSLYTSNSSEELENFIRYAERATLDTDHASTVERLAHEIRNNIPNNVIVSLQNRVRDRDSVYETLARAKSIHDNLAPADRNVYGAILQTTIDELESEAIASIRDAIHNN